MLLWIVFEVSVLFICEGLTVIDPDYSQLTSSKQEQRTETDIHDDHNKNDDDSVAVTIDDSSYYRLLHRHIVNSVDSIHTDELKEENQERLEKLEEIVKLIQTNMPLSDGEVIHSLLQNIVNDTLRTDYDYSNETSSLADLEALRDYLHQVDNAVDFGKMGGLAVMLQLVLEYPLIEVRTSAAWTIGIACQNNPLVMQIAHNISTVQNILYILKVSNNNNHNYQYPKLNLLDVNDMNHLSKLIWTLSSLTRQNQESYRIFKKYDGTDVVYEWIMETYNFWNKNQDNPQLLNDNYKNKVIEKILMFASDVVVLNPEQNLFIDEKWCFVFAAHINYAQKHYQLREITLAYWDVAINKLFCLNCIPFNNSKENISNHDLSIDIGLNKLMTMDVEDEFDLEMKSKATHLVKLIQNTII